MQIFLFKKTCKFVALKLIFSNNSLFMKVTTFLFFVFISTTVWAQNEAYLDDFKEKWNSAAQYSLEVAEAMPEDGYTYQPAEDFHTFQEQFMHAIENMIWLSTTYMTNQTFEGDLKKEKYTKAEMITLLKSAFDFTTEAVDQLEPHDLNMTVKFFAGPKKLRQILTLMNDHMTHHRAQAILYLRMKGVEPPKYRGW